MCILCHPIHEKNDAFFSRFDLMGEKRLKEIIENFKPIHENKIDNIAL